jgi:fatty-acyl-CoA synthase
MIEEGLMRHPAVEIAAAVGKPDARAGELPMAYVTLRRGAQCDPAELLAHARSAITERAAVPVEVVVLEAMPLTAVNKIFKPALRQRAIAQALTEAVQSACGPVEVQVAVEPHPKHGLEARISAARPAGPEAEARMQAAQDRLAALPVHWTLAWRAG